MGCWEETCGLTGFPIFANQPCVLVLIDPNMINLGTMLGYSTGDLKCVKAIHKGTYNDYGSLNELKYNKELMPIFFHLDIWEKCWKYEKDNPDLPRDESHIEMMYTGVRLPPLLGGNDDEYEMPSFADEFYYIVQFAIKTRRDLLAGLKFRGIQDWAAFEKRGFLIELMQEQQKKELEWRDG